MRPAMRNTPAQTQRNMFMMHVLQLLLGLGAVQPLSRVVSVLCWKAFTVLSALTHYYKIRIRFGRPPALMTQRESEQWERRTISTDTQFLQLCVTFIGCPLMHLVIVPIWIQALYHAIEYANSQYGGMLMWQLSGAKLQHVLYAYREEALTLSALSEIGIGFWLLVKLWYHPWSYALHVYAYWKAYLPLRYAMPESAAYHRRVWQAAASVARPLLQSSAVLRDSISDVTRWFDITLIPPE